MELSLPVEMKTRISSGTHYEDFLVVVVFLAGVFFVVVDFAVLLVAVFLVVVAFFSVDALLAVAVIEVTSSFVKDARNHRVRAYRFLAFILKTFTFSPRCSPSILHDTFAPESVGVPIFVSFPSSSEIKRGANVIVFLSVSSLSTRISSHFLTIYCLPPVSITAIILMHKNYKWTKYIKNLWMTSFLICCLLQKLYAHTIFHKYDYDRENCREKNKHHSSGKKISYLGVSIGYWERRSPHVSDHMRSLKFVFCFRWVFTCGFDGVVIFYHWYYFSHHGPAFDSSRGKKIEPMNMQAHDGHEQSFHDFQVLYIFVSDFLPLMVNIHKRWLHRLQLCDQK